MPKVARPAQGNNTNKKIVKKPAGGDNVRTSGIPKVNNHKPRRAT